MNEFAGLETWKWQKRLLARTFQLYKVLRGSPLNVQFSTHRDVTMHILFLPLFNNYIKLMLSVLAVQVLPLESAMNRVCIIFP